MAKKKEVEKKEEIPMTVQEAPKVAEAPAIVTAPAPVAPPVNLPGMKPTYTAENYRWYNEWKKDTRKVWGVFRDIEGSGRGGKISFHFKKYAPDEIELYTFEDGKRYEIPLGVVKHINSICNTEDSYSNDLVSADGRPLKNPNPKKVNRFSFSPDEYMDM